ncbi:MAG: hypothetical protein O3A87_08640 [Verrucomicrobia bacterium]|nr:hypothetical protein [Verrucomicrobiota bacterium]
MADKQSRTPSTRSPLAGCTIVIVGICAMAFLVGFVIWNLFKLDKEIAKFTTDQAVPIPAPDLVEDITAYNDFKSRIEIFKDTEGNGDDATLELTAHDINMAIASFDEFTELRHTFSVSEVVDGKLHIAISFPLRGKPLSDEMRYLNGTMIAVPKLVGDEIILDIEKIEVPDAVVPDGFIGQMSPYRISQRYMEDELLGGWMKRLTAVSVNDGKVALTVNAAQAAEEELPEDVSPFVNRFLLVTGASAAGFIGIVVILALLAKRRRKTSSAPEPPEAGQH